MASHADLKVLRSLCRDFHLHFQVLWLTPPLKRCCLKVLLEKKRFSREVLAYTARFLHFASLETLRFLAPEGRRGFTIRLKRLKPRAPDFGGPQNFGSKDNFQHFCKQYICIFVLVQRTFCYYAANKRSL